MNSLLARMRATTGRRASTAAEDEETEEEAAGAAAETEDEETAAAAEDSEDEEDTAAEDGDDEEEDDTPEMAAARASGRRAERQRWSQVMGHAAATGRTAAAVRILGGSDMPAADTIALLGDLPKGQAANGGDGFVGRMRGQKPPSIGSDGGKGAETPGARLAARMAARDKQRPGAKRPGRNGE